MTAINQQKYRKYEIILAFLSLISREPPRVQTKLNRKMASILSTLSSSVQLYTKETILDWYGSHGNVIFFSSYWFGRFLTGSGLMIRGEGAGGMASVDVLLDGLKVLRSVIYGVTFRGNDVDVIRKSQISHLSPSKLS